MNNRAALAAFLALCIPMGALQADEKQMVDGFTDIAASQEIKATVNKAYPVRKHAGAVLSLAQIPGTSDFFSAGADGFITLQRSASASESWQISDLPIRKMVVHPDGNTIAVYESDGFSIHRVSVWNWKTKNRLYAKRFRDSVISISWSAKGSYLIVGNTSVDGITVLDGRSGNPKNVYRKSPGIVSLSLTGNSESTIMTLGPSGKILYTDMSSGSEKASYPTEADITAPVSLNNNSKIAGIAGDGIILIDATSGKTLGRYPVTGTVILATSAADALPVWCSSDATGNWNLSTGDSKSASFMIPDGSAISAALSLPDQMIIGTAAGNMYACTKPATKNENITLTSRANENYLSIDDLATDGTRIFVLAGGSVFISSGPGKAPVFAFTGLSANRFLLQQDSLLCWSTLKNDPLIRTSFDGETRTVIYQPKEPIHSVSAGNTAIACIEGTKQAVVIDSGANKKPFIYAGAGLQDAVFVADDKILVSKSATARAPWPLLLINTGTGETVPIQFQADLCYGLKSSDYDGHVLHAFFVHAGTIPTTEIARIDIDVSSPGSTAVRTEATYQDEDLAATLAFDDGSIITNLGKSSLTAIDTAKNRQMTFDRGQALPLKAAVMDQFIASLNYDGSITWFDNKTGRMIGDAAIASDGSWIED